MRLVKTSIDFAYYNDSKDITLLGDWCLNDQEDILGSVYKFERTPYHWDDREKFNSDYIYLTDVYEKTLDKLALSLNKIHKTEEGSLYWRIIVGPWLRFFIDAVFDRYECVRQVTLSNSIIECELFSYKLSDWCPLNFSEFYNDFCTDEWNEVVFSEIIKYQKLSFVENTSTYVSQNSRSSTQRGITENLKKAGKLFSSAFSTAFERAGTRVLFVAPYVSPLTAFKLQFNMGQFPLLGLPSIKTKPSAYNLGMRKELFTETDDTNFEGFLNFLIPHLLPKIYLEDFANYKNRILKRYSVVPKVIFTANAYQADDIFKIWAAENIKNEVPLIIGQHGGNFSISQHNQTVDHQLKIANKFVSWGWDRDTEDHIIKLPSMQLSDRANIAPNFKGQVLHVLSSLPRYFYCHYSIPVAGQFLSYIEDQLKFISNLDQDQFKCLKIRLDLSSPDMSWDVTKILKINGYGQKIDSSTSKLSASLRHSKLCICTHNSMVFLETLSMNFPTIVFWNPMYYEINDGAKPFFNMLMEAGILFHCPESAAEKVNSIEDNIEQWWYSDLVQSARIKFCQQYAQSSADWKDQWSEFFGKL